MSDNNETETISCSLPEFREQVKPYERLVLLVVGRASEAAERFAERLGRWDFNLNTAVLVAEGDCKELVSDYLRVKQAPAAVVLEHGEKRGEVAISGDFDKDIEELKKICQ